jgi:hypothetical protein
MSALKPELYDQRRHPLLGNGSANTIPQQPNHMTTATDTHATTEKLLEAVFSVGSMLKLYTGNQMVCAIHTLYKRPSIFIGDKPILLSERML